MLWVRLELFSLGLARWRYCVASFIFIVAGLNLALGYLLALYLAPHFGLPALSSLSSVGAPPIGGPAVEPALLQSAGVMVLETGVAEAPQSEAEEASAIQSGLPTENAPTEEPPVAASAQKPELVGELIEEFKDDLVRYRDQLAALDRRMRAEPDPEDPSAMQACLADLFAANARYLAQTEDSNDRLQRGCAAVEEHKPIGRQLGPALQQQVGEVRQANQNLAGIDPQENNQLGRERIFSETARLIDASHTLRDTLDDVEQQLAGQSAPREDFAGSDAELPGRLVSRALLEGALADCWSADPDRAQPLSVGLVDLDGCRDLNEGRGPQAADRLLAMIAQLIAGSLEPGQMASRLSGEKFMVLLKGCNGHAATAALEHIRQHVESTRFQAGTAQFSAAVSCAVSESAFGDTFDGVLERLETTLQEAKRYGRNRTFFHDGKFATPVVPPILSLEPRTQEI
jgi:diguanylate cyclase (GGDEF)-like protein